MYLQGMLVIKYQHMWLTNNLQLKLANKLHPMSVISFHLILKVIKVWFIQVQAYPSQQATSSVPVNPHRNIDPERNHPHGGGITQSSDTPHGGVIVPRRDIPHGGGIPAQAILNSTGNQSGQQHCQDPTALDDPNQPLVTD